MTVVDDPSPPDAAPPVSGAPARGRSRRGDGPQRYDFRRPTKLSREHARTLQIICETFARQYTTVLTTTLRVVASVGLLSIEQQTYDEYVSTMNNPTYMGILTVEPLPGAGVFELSLSTAMAAVDHLLGGPGGSSQPERPLSDIESALMRGLVDRALRELRYALEPVVHLEPELVSVEYNPQFAQAAAPTDLVLVASFELRIGEAECIATICLPFNPLFAKLEAAAGQNVTSERERAAREAARRTIARRLTEVPVDVAVRFASSRLSSAQLADLEVGDVLPMRHAVSAPLAVTAADVTFAHAVPGTQGKRLACLVVDPPEEETR